MKKIEVNDMSCMSCVKKIQTELLKNKINAKIDLSSHQISVLDNELELAVKIIKDLGYTPQVW